MRVTTFSVVLKISDSKVRRKKERGLKCNLEYLVNSSFISGELDSSERSWFGTVLCSRKKNSCHSTLCPAFKHTPDSVM